MKHGRADVRSKARLGLGIRFEPQSLTSYSGLVAFQHLFLTLGVRERLWGCFRHLGTNPIYGRHVVMMLPVVHLIIGHRRLRDMDTYRDDGMVKRILGLKRLPDVSTVSRSLATADEGSVAKVRNESRRLVMERLARERFSRVTLDYDGSVLSTGRHAEGTAVGFNRKRKGARSCYPLFRTIARTDQVLDVHHRPGNVRDSKGAESFIGHRMGQIRSCLPHARVETRIDSAFFNQTIVQLLHSSKAKFTVSVPFERFPTLKDLVEGKKNGAAWRRESITSKHVGSRSRGMPDIDSFSSESGSGTDTNSRSNSTCFNPLNTDMNSRPLSPTGGRTRAMSLPSMKAAGRRRASSPNSRRTVKWITYRSGHGSATNSTCSPASLPTTSPASSGSKSTAAPAVRPQSVPHCGAFGRWKPFAVPSSGAPDALFDRAAN